MKVAYLCSQYPHVTHTFIRREIRGLEACGFDVLRLAIQRPGERELPDPSDRAELAGTIGILERGPRLIWDVIAAALTAPVAWVRALWRAVRFGMRSHRGITRHLAYFVESCAILRILRRDGVGHVHAHFGESTTMVALLVHALGGAGYSFQIHGPGEFDAPEFIHLPEKVAQARFVTTITDFARGQTLRWSAPEQWSKVHVVRCGVDERFLAGAAVPVPDVPRFLNIGRLSRSKAQLLLVDAVSRLLEEGRQFEVVVIGSGELRERLEAAIASRDIGGALRLVGVKNGDEVRDELLRSRALVLPSFGEGLPVAIMEAFALGRPVIATRIAGIPELVEEGRNGWLIPAGNVDRLVDAMRDALDAPVAVLTAMGSRGRAAVRERHDAAREASKLADLLRPFCV